MIVELFGPPGAGKTTFARELAAELARAGWQVEVHLSARPGEASAPSGAPSRMQRLIAPASRLLRPALRLAAAGAFGRRPAADADAIQRIVAAVPARGAFGALRMRQYLVRLSVAWTHAAARRGVVLFDQAWAQAALTAIADRSDGAALDLHALIGATPAADLAIRIDAPLDEIERRLARRLEAMGRVGAWFEAGAAGAQAQVDAADRIAESLEALGRKMIRIAAGERRDLLAGVDRATGEISRIAGAGGPSAAPRAAE